jgi:hypothetical protein
MAARNTNAVYEKYLHIKENMTDVFSINFNLTKEVLTDLPFLYFAGLGDVVFAELFQGIPQKVQFEEY